MLGQAHGPTENRSIRVAEQLRCLGDLSAEQASGRLDEAPVDSRDVSRQLSNPLV